VPEAILDVRGPGTDFERTTRFSHDDFVACSARSGAMFGALSSSWRTSRIRFS